MAVVIARYPVNAPLPDLPNPSLVMDIHADALRRRIALYRRYLNEGVGSDLAETYLREIKKPRPRSLSFFVGGARNIRERLRDCRQQHETMDIDGTERCLLNERVLRTELGDGRSAGKAKTARQSTELPGR